MGLVVEEIEILPKFNNSLLWVILVVSGKQINSLTSGNDSKESFKIKSVSSAASIIDKRPIGLEIVFEEINLMLLGLMLLYKFEFIQDIVGVVGCEHYSA